MRHLRRSTSLRTLAAWGRIAAALVLILVGAAASSCCDTCCVDPLTDLSCGSVNYGLPNPTQYYDVVGVDQTLNSNCPSSPYQITLSLAANNSTYAFKKFYCLYYGYLANGDCSNSTGVSDYSSSCSWQSTDLRVARYVPPTGTSSAGQSVPVSDYGYFVIDSPGSVTLKGVYHGGTGNVALTVTAPSPGASPAATPLLFGDGSQGALTISADTDWTAVGVPGGQFSFTPQFTNFTLNAGATLTVPSGVNIRCQGKATINGKIRVLQDMASAKAGGINGPDPVDKFGAVSVNTSGLSQAAAAAIVKPGLVGGTQAGDTTGQAGGAFGIRAAGGIAIGATGLIDASAPIPSAPGQTGGSLFYKGTITEESGGGGGGVVVLVWGKGSKFINNGAPGVNCNGASPTPFLNSLEHFYECGCGGGGGIVRLIGPGATAPPASAVTVNGGVAPPTVQVVQVVGTTTANVTLPTYSEGPAGGSGGAGGSVGLYTGPPASGSDGWIIPTNVPDPAAVVPPTP